MTAELLGHLRCLDETTGLSNSVWWPVLLLAGAVTWIYTVDRSIQLNVLPL